jgi:beta-1,2-mannobiose phosphorylase / 1,2-beta-oligomannan phosphorylase
MTDRAARSLANPLLTPDDVRPSRPGLTVECVLNPGVFTWQGRTGLLLRVAERPVPERGWVSTAVLGPDGEIDVVRFRTDDTGLDVFDPRLIRHDGVTYLTTLSHLRLAWSDDAERFTVEDEPALSGLGPAEVFGIEDARVTCLDGCYHIVYTAVSGAGHGVGLAATRDWRSFQRGGLILPPPNKDAVIFPERVGGRFRMYHRPTTPEFAGHCIWTAASDDLVHWSDHRFVAGPRRGAWDGARVGAGGPPIRTPSGWLSIYHGATPDHRYCLGLLLADLGDPAKVIARSVQPVMCPVPDYETAGFMGGVVFTNGHTVEGDRVRVYYGASDRVVCAADFSLGDLLGSLP